MKILYIFGNGFDLSLGAPTDYKHFLKYYNTLKSGKIDSYIEPLLNHLNKKQIETWFDLELELGKATSCYKKVDDFLKAFNDLRRNMTTYMKRCNDFLTEYINDASPIIVNNLCNFQKYLLPNDLYEYERKYGFLSKEKEKLEFEIYALTLNYTLAYEAIQEQCENDIRLWDVDVLEKHADLKLYNCKHLHRSLKDKGFILGVDNETQIENQEFVNDERISMKLIKPYACKSINELINKQCYEMLSKVDIIIIYGCSLGSTDKTLCSEIGKVLKSNNQIVLYKFEYDETEYENDDDEVLINGKYKKTLIDKLFSSGEINENIRRRIHIIQTAKMFNDENNNNNVCLEENFKKILSSITSKK